MFTTGDSDHPHLSPSQIALMKLNPLDDDAQVAILGGLSNVRVPE